uniref:Uncharacterized protein n=1 Tax=Anguilla anguilla TaxID=7936 RepID=A0A0E9QAJ6_ANGAN
MTRKCLKIIAGLQQAPNAKIREGKFN